MSQNNQITPLNRCLNFIKEQEEAFINLANEYNSDVKFKQEALFAYQLLQKSDSLVKTAAKNPESLKNAILNVASIGLTLNPIERKAYLIPRKGGICLDISYIGLADVAIGSGMIRNVVARVVYEKDTFEVTGVDTPPMHKFDPFLKDRGAKTGVYCVAKTVDGDYLTEPMSIEDCYQVRKRSESFKYGSGSWISDENEMLKKTAVKRACKLWPKNNASRKLDLAIGALNEHEGIDFDQEKEDIKKAREEHKVAQKQAIDDKQKMLKEIPFLFDQYCKEKDLDKLAAGAYMHKYMDVNKLSDLKRKGNDCLEKILSNLRDFV